LSNDQVAAEAGLSTRPQPCRQRWDRQRHARRAGLGM